MKTRRTFSGLAFWAALAGFAGASAFAAVELFGNPSALDVSILIERPPHEVFRALVDPANVDKISQNIGNVQLDGSGWLAQGSHYQRVLYSHGIPNPQTVTVTEFEQNKLLVTTTTLVGFNVTYRYVLSSTSDGKTALSLTKSGSGGWVILRPLMIHLLTRPEHDGGHLMLIKRLVEAAP
jgi:uncharacterized protein YndB with AHSA1/START domain